MTAGSGTDACDEISVGLFDDSDHAHPDCLLALLGNHERQRHHAMRHARRARQYLASRWLLRTHLARWLDRSPEELRLHSPVDGPPALSDTPCRIGLSHSGNLCLCIVSKETRVGCDVEQNRIRPKLLTIAQHFFHPCEAARLRTQDDALAYSDFYRLWTLKEAALKAVGRGIASGLRAPAFDLNRPSMHAAAGSAHWTHVSSHIRRNGTDYSLALAIDRPEAVFRVHEYSARSRRRVCRPLPVRWDTAHVLEPLAQQ